MLLPMNNDSYHQSEDPFVCLILSCKWKNIRADNMAIWQQSTLRSASQRVLYRRKAFTWRVCSPWYHLDDRRGSIARCLCEARQSYTHWQSVNTIGKGSGKEGMKTFYPLFDAFSNSMLKLIPRIIQIFQVTLKECYLSFMLTPVLKKFQ